MHLEGTMIFPLASLNEVNTNLSNFMNVLRANLLTIGWKQTVFQCSAKRVIFLVIRGHYFFYDTNIIWEAMKDKIHVNWTPSFPYLCHSIVFVRVPTHTKFMKNSFSFFPRTNYPSHYSILGLYKGA